MLWHSGHLASISQKLLDLAVKLLLPGFALRMSSMHTVNLCVCHRSIPLQERLGMSSCHYTQTEIMLVCQSSVQHVSRLQLFATCRPQARHLSVPMLHSQDHSQLAHMLQPVDHQACLVLAAFTRPSIEALPASNSVSWYPRSTEGPVMMSSNAASFTSLLK